MGFYACKDQLQSTVPEQYNRGQILSNTFWIPGKWDHCSLLTFVLKIWEV